MLAGSEFPTMVLQACLQGLEGQSRTVGVVNLTPYDAHLERVCLHWQLRHGLDSPKIDTLSVSDQNEEVLSSERFLAQQMMKDFLKPNDWGIMISSRSIPSRMCWRTVVLLFFSVQEWKAGSPLFEGYPKYAPDFQQNTTVDLKDYPLRLAQVTHDPSKKGVKQYSFSLPPSVRALYSRDSIRAEDWKQLILDFDAKSFSWHVQITVHNPLENMQLCLSQSQRFRSIFGNPAPDQLHRFSCPATPLLCPCRFQISAVEEAALVPLVPVEDVQPWQNEPSCLEEMLDRYIVENKMPASVAGGMLYLTKAATRAGELVDVVPDQKHKLFLAPGH